jgi:dihydropyrimidinase
MPYDLILRGGTLVTECDEQRADLAVADGKVAAILRAGEGEARTVIDVAGKHVIPGVIDPHVHYGLGNGLSEWETETRSSAIGGVTTAFSFLMSGQGYVPMIEEAVRTASETAHIDYGLHAVPCAPVHLAEMDSYVDLGITSFKYFTSFRGDEGAYLNVTGTDDGFLYEYLERIAGFAQGLACIHAENIEVVWRLRARLQAAGRDDLRAWDESRPASIEAEAAHRAMVYAREVGARLYLVHMSSQQSLDEIRDWRARHREAIVYAETCPHFLTHHKDMPLGPIGKINPPLRSADEVEAVWRGLFDGTVDTIGSDHVARRKDKKAGSIWKSSAGFPGTGAILPVLLSEGVHKRGLPLTRVVALTSANPARALGIYPQKGNLRVGADADIAVIDLGLERRAGPETFASNADYSLYDGWVLRGWPIRTFVRGYEVARDGAVVGSPGYGKYIRRSSTRNAVENRGVEWQDHK